MNSSKPRSSVPFLSRKKNNTVLIIEKDKVVANMLKAYLQLFGLKVFTSSDGSKRTQLKIKKMRFSVVVANIDLEWAPVIENMEALVLNGIQSGLVLITSGGYVDKNISRGFYRHFGQKLLLVQPYTLHELKKVILSTIDNIEAERDYFAIKYFK